MEATQHDDFYKRLREKVTRWADQQKLPADLRDYLLAAPDLFHLLCRLVLEPRVAAREKALLGVGIAYVVSPLDLIPDLLGPLGFVDDLIVMVVILDTVLKRVPREVVEGHWAGTGDLLKLVRESLDKADSWVGKGLFRRIRAWLEDQGVLSRTAGAKGARASEAVPPPTPAARRAAAGGGKAAAPKAGKATAAAKPKPAARKKTAKKASAKKAAARKATKTIGPRGSGAKSGSGA